MDLLVFQGLSAAIIWRRITEMRKTDFDRSVQDWVTERSVQRAEKALSRGSKTFKSQRSMKRTERFEIKVSSSWVPKRLTMRTERSDGGESSGIQRTYSYPSPTKNKPERCACCPDFAFGCLQKLEIIDEDDSDLDSD